MIKASRCQLMVLAALVSLSACNPTIKVEAPDKPITINMNIKIEHEIRVKVEKDLENVLSKDSGLF
ncbi:MAG: YnbE family lipoprotein [Zetaproteobacteria bacterium CG11_big_fil_rev_8_21_14_0_20_59_439]|nr:MAG: YnbE family lipoprotein [Zetaproteobacteria bacterium CG2_30_59_37]PIQ65681.1 MAG: YnbE family lipoprotein [Zetaproteobacteria bacterium CG11_big_fil_rev_8_21_14_0_20_59_439]PIU98160.1 MAG: YnbE family lipoprotein [Zetaproteobacteria bacterium CG03_land_8_20_14_0_80_59_51]